MCFVAKNKTLGEEGKWHVIYLYKFICKICTEVLFKWGRGKVWHIARFPWMW